MVNPVFIFAERIIGWQSGRAGITKNNFYAFSEQTLPDNFGAGLYFAYN